MLRYRFWLSVLENAKGKKIDVVGTIYKRKSLLALRASRNIEMLLIIQIRSIKSLFEPCHTLTAVFFKRLL